jgi:hypothetical protein
MFDTISEFKAAMGTCGLGPGFVEGGGGIGFAGIFASLKGVGAGFGVGLTGLEDVVFGVGAAFV